MLKNLMLWLKPRSRLRNGVVAVSALVIGISLAVAATSGARRADTTQHTERPETGRRVGDLYYPPSKQWDSFTVESVAEMNFPDENLTEGKIAVDEDRSTLVYSPYAGRVVKLFAKPGDIVKAGQQLFAVESPDMVQAQNDFISALSALNKAQAALNLAKIVEQQNKTLYENKAGPLRDLQQSQANALSTQNDLHAAQIALEAVRNRMRILGKTDDEITKFRDTGIIDPLTTIYSPITGTVVQRKVGPGQYVNTSSNNAAASDATFVVGDLSTVWLVAYVRESEARNIKVGQRVRFTVMAYPDRIFEAAINYVATSLDPATRRLQVRATIDNHEGLLRPEMFASVRILTGEQLSPGTPRDSLVYDGSTAHVWVVNDDRSVQKRAVKIGLSHGKMIQVLEGLRVGEKVVSKGTLFVDREATSGS